MALAIVWIWSLLVNAPLEMPSDPTFSPNPAKAPWYFLGLQELLVYFDPWIAGVVFRTLMIVGLMCIPYLDTSRAAIGTFAPKARPFAVSFFAAGLLLWFGLIFVGMFLRGPSWAWYWPWESWEIHKTVPLTHSVSPVLGWLLTGAYFGLGWLIPRRLKFLGSLDVVRYTCVMFFVLCTVGILLKIGLRLLLNIKYVLVTPWFNI